MLTVRIVLTTIGLILTGIGLTIAIKSKFTELDAIIWPFVGLIPIQIALFLSKFS